ncbi:MAG: hypothetical protein ABSE22_14590 [Xanthobacteraceae bacterium]
MREKKPWRKVGTAPSAQATRQTLAGARLEDYFDSMRHGGRQAIRRNEPHIVWSEERIAGIARAGGIKIRPRFLAALNAKRPYIGTVAFGARERRTGLDFRR